MVSSTAANFDPAAHLDAITVRRLDQPALHARARAYHLQIQGTLTALPGANDYIKAARRLGLRLVVASSSSLAWVEGYLRQLGLFDAFDVIICWEDVCHIKPDPEQFLTALDALKLRPDERLVFEDSPTA